MTATASSTNGDAPESGHILRSLMIFGEVLRGVGLDIGSGNMLDLVRAMEFVPFSRKQDFQQTARSILVHRKQDLALFDETFQVFWRPLARGQTTLDLRSLGEERRYRKPQVAPPPSADDEGEGGPPGIDDDPAADRVDLTRTYSAREVLREKDFADFKTNEIADARRMMAELSWDLGFRRTRRKTPGDGAWLDLGKTLSRSIKYGGEMLELAYRRRKDKPRPLILICDVSGSMERYTRMLLHFIHSVARGPEQVEAFLFATRLTRITRYLNYRSIDQAVSEVSRAVPDWAGGTRIGQSIKTFNFQWLRRVLRGGAVVLVISDGWDRGEPELLGKEMERLQRNCHRLIWLNPLLGSATFRPLTRGMQAALPYVDDFLPVHNLNSLEALARHLNNLGAHRTLGPHYRTPTTEQPAPEVAQSPAPDIDPALAPTFRHPLWRKNR
ncbi:MAG: VWA domain-containing protein [Chloroflexi bacterium]|nr:VWA domain-containing protein [Chloroflexota bacterium]